MIYHVSRVYISNNKVKSRKDGEKESVDSTPKQKQKKITY